MAGSFYRLARLKQLSLLAVVLLSWLVPMSTATARCYNPEAIASRFEEQLKEEQALTAKTAYTDVFDPGEKVQIGLLRWYDPNLQRWVNRDPIGELGGINLYRFADNSPVNRLDRNGLDVWIEGPSGSEPEFHLSINVGDPLGRYDSFSFGITKFSPFGHVYEDWERGGKIKDYARTTPSQDASILADLQAELDTNPGVFYGMYNCRSFSKDKFDQYKAGFGLQESAPPARTPAPRDWWRNPLFSGSTMLSGSGSISTLRSLPLILRPSSSAP